MWSWLKRTKSENTKGEKACARTSERLETAVLSCDLGTLLDVSKGGMRIRSTRSSLTDQSGCREVELFAPADSIMLKVRLVRSEAFRGGWYEHSFAFVDLSDTQKQELENLARTGRRKPAGATLAGNRRDLVLEAAKMPDHYATLQIGPQATTQEVHLAFRRLARLYHPDINPDPAAQERFCRINEAHEILGDEARRGEYDALYRIRSAA